MIIMLSCLPSMPPSYHQAPVNYYCFDKKEIKEDAYSLAVQLSCYLCYNCVMIVTAARHRSGKKAVIMPKGSLEKR